MEKLGTFLLSILILAIFGLIGYWSISTMQSGAEHVASEKIKQLQKENNDLKKEMKDLTGELDTLSSKLKTIESTSVAKEEKVPAQIEQNTQPAPTVYKYQILINELQKLIDDDISMKLKSSGTRVGTLQIFFNIYNKTNTEVDNSYGVGTQKLE